MGDYYEFRRHRLNPNETPLVMGLIREKLLDLTIQKKDLSLAEEFYKILWRIQNNKHGRPNYPKEVTWGCISSLLGENKGPFLEVEEVAIV